MIPSFFKSRLDKSFHRQLYGEESGPTIDFSQPVGEPALVPPDSISWIVFNNPISLFIGGVAAVLLELAEPKIRTGVWEHTTFRTDPLRRMRRTGLAAMVTVYGPRSVAEKMIAGVRRMHDGVQGNTPDGIAYRANDPELLRWVHATAAFGFLQAYHTFVKPVSPGDRDRYYAEGVPVAKQYGAESSPASEAEIEELFDTMNPRLEPSDIVFEFLDIMRNLALFPQPLGRINHLIVRASIDILPMETRKTLGLDSIPRLGPISRNTIRLFGKLADSLDLPTSPAHQSKIRLQSQYPGPSVGEARNFQ